ncbi:unnamed protein product [Schistocephalus solidus]|uniref:C2H2-type domain-containing protein n=1 Tax=Schistocephalus solidus TaxID=70667 RepID=A0A183TFY5_SCHSO|nr:unnamed protein product [Schistocephalus solidus]
MGLFGHMRIHDSGIHHNADNTDTPCTPSAPAIHTATATPTTMNDILPASTDFSCTHCANNFNSRIGLVGHLQIRHTEAGETVVNSNVDASSCYPTLSSCSLKLVLPSGHTPGNRHDWWAKPDGGFRPLPSPLLHFSSSPLLSPLFPLTLTFSLPFPSSLIILSSPTVKKVLRQRRHNPRSYRPERKTALVTRKLARYMVDIAALSETRFSEQGQLEDVGAGYTFFWSGRPKAE